MPLWPGRAPDTRPTGQSPPDGPECPGRFPSADPPLPTAARQALAPRTASPERRSVLPGPATLAAPSKPRTGPTPQIGPRRSVTPREPRGKPVSSHRRRDRMPPAVADRVPPATHQTPTVPLDPGIGPAALPPYRPCPEAGGTRPGPSTNGPPARPRGSPPSPSGPARAGLPPGAHRRSGARQTAGVDPRPAGRLATSGAPSRPSRPAAAGTPAETRSPFDPRPLPEPPAPRHPTIAPDDLSAPTARPAIRPVRATWAPSHRSDARAGPVRCGPAAGPPGEGACDAGPAFETDRARATPRCWLRPRPGSPSRAAPPPRSQSRVPGWPEARRSSRSAPARPRRHPPARPRDSAGPALRAP